MVSPVKVRMGEMAETQRMHMQYCSVTRPAVLARLPGRSVFGEQYHERRLLGPFHRRYSWRRTVSATPGKAD